MKNNYFSINDFSYFVVILKILNHRDFKRFTTCILNIVMLFLFNNLFISRNYSLHFQYLYYIVSKHFIFIQFEFLYI